MAKMLTFSFFNIKYHVNTKQGGFDGIFVHLEDDENETAASIDPLHSMR